jgi:hypothetical protein
MRRNIFVFGSNLAGRHGKGAALTAKNLYGAVYGQGVGLQGSSYAIPTKDANLQILPLGEIQRHVSTFIEFAKARPNSTFQLTAIGCGLAGYDPADIAPMFADAPANVIQPPEFKPFYTDAEIGLLRKQAKANNEKALNVAKASGVGINPRVAAIKRRAK